MRGSEHGTDVLVHQVDRRLALLGPECDRADLVLAQRLAVTLRELVVSTACASAADRARVRVAVHYFVLRRSNRGNRMPPRSLTADQRVINDIARTLGRPDLVVETATA